MRHQNEERLMTGEELARYTDFHGELVNGRPVPMPMAGRSHAQLVMRLGAKLVSYAEATGRGRVLGGEAGIYTRRNPDTVRGTGALFISHERYARGGPLTFLDVAGPISLGCLREAEGNQAAFRIAVATRSFGDSAPGISVATQGFGSRRWTLPSRPQVF